MPTGQCLSCGIKFESLCFAGVPVTENLHNKASTWLVFQIELLEKGRTWAGKDQDPKEVWYNQMTQY